MPEYAVEANLNAAIGGLFGYEIVTRGPHITLGRPVRDWLIVVHSSLRLHTITQVRERFKSEERSSLISDLLVKPPEYYEYG